jgi:hypothetical protein
MFVPCALCCCPSQVEGDTAKLSDAYYTVQVLNKHVQKISAVQGSLVNMMEDDDTPPQTLGLAYDFISSGFSEDWDKRSKQATTDMVVAAAILDPRCAPADAAAQQQLRHVA